MNGRRGILFELDYTDEQKRAYEDFEEIADEHINSMSADSEDSQPKQEQQCQQSLNIPIPISNW